MPKSTVTTRPNDLYERDFFAWTQHQADLLREKRFDDLDLENLIDEVASVGGSEKREIVSRLKVLVAHLIKWRFQPGARSPGWAGTIREQRDRLRMVLDMSPSLKNHPVENLDHAWLSGRLLAAKETGIDFSLFPEKCPFTIEQVLDENFWPKDAGLLDQS
jgi:hypothetical protein